MTDRNSEFARLLQAMEQPPSDNTQVLGYLMRDWLKSAVADSGTSVDTGGGMGCFDLWVKVGGEEIYVSLKSKGGLQ